MSEAAPVLQVQDLSTVVDTRLGALKAVDGLSFAVERGEILGLVGESGSGKSMTAFSILGLLDPPARIAGGRVLFGGEDLVGLPEPALRSLRGSRLAMVFQDPMMTLNPVLRIGTQMVEAILAHRPMARAAARARAAEALAQVGIAAPEERLRSYPVQLSGGMRQRVAIAIALLNGPDLLIADEPTTGLDVTIQAQILALVREEARRRGLATLWISHDLAVIANLADRVCVMYAGRGVETGPVDAVLDRPLHPYTRGLIGALPDRNRRGQPLAQIPGMAPSLAALPAGCAFRARCPRASDACLVAPAERNPLPGRSLRCHHPLEAAA